MAEYRPVPEADGPDFRRIARYAFGAAQGPHDPDEELDERLERLFSFGEDRGMYEGDDLRVVCSHIPFTVRVRDTWLAMPGLTAVASPPEHRRQGLVGDMLRASLEEYRERDWPLSGLHPFDEAFYARYGWATGCLHHRATVDVDALGFAQDAATGSFHRVDPEAAGAELDDVYRAWMADRELATERSEDWWRDRIFNTWQNELYGYAWTRDGDVRGYVVYDVTDDDGGTLKAYEMAYDDHEAHLNLLRFCHDHDSQLDTVELHGYDLRPLFDVVGDRGAVDLEVVPSTMVRVVDVPMALEAIDYPDVTEATVTLAVADDHAPWNEATWAVTVADGTATVTETDAEPEATVDVNTLSQLYVGHHDVATARRIGGLDVADEAATGALAAMFPERQPFMPEGF